MDVLGIEQWTHTWIYTIGMCGIAVFYAIWVAKLAFK